MKKQFDAFKQEMDRWVKEYQSDLESVRTLPTSVEENTQNIDHNYEIMQEVRLEIGHLKEEISALRTLQYLSIKAQGQAQKINNQ